MTSTDVNMLLEHYKLQVSELSRICGELTRMQHVNNKIIGVLERHIRDDIGNNNTESRSVLGELRDLLLFGENTKSSNEASMKTDNSSPSDERTMSTVVERENWSRLNEIRQVQEAAKQQLINTVDTLEVTEVKLAVKDEPVKPAVPANGVGDFGSSPVKVNSKRGDVSPQKRPDSVSPSHGSAAYSVSPARRIAASASPRSANDDVASSFDEHADDPVPASANDNRAEVSTSSERHAASANEAAVRQKPGVISSAELNKLVDELSNASPTKKPTGGKQLGLAAKFDKKAVDAALWQAYSVNDYVADVDDEEDTDSETATSPARPHTAPGATSNDYASVPVSSASVVAALRAKYPDSAVRQSTFRQRAAWVHDPLIQRAFSRLPWLVRGHMTRQLIQTDKVQQLKRTIRDSADIFADLYREIRERARLQAAGGRSQPASAPLTLTTEQKFLRDRILKQLRAALFDVHSTFHEMSSLEQVRLIAQHHAAVRERERRAHNSAFDDESPAEDDVLSPRVGGSARERQKPRLSSATLKKLEREARERSGSQHNIAPQSARSDEPTNGVNGVSSRRYSSRLTRTRSTGAMENRPRTAPARDHPPSKPLHVNGTNEKSRVVLRNMQQPAIEKDRLGTYRPVAMPLGAKAQQNGINFGNGTYTKATSQRLRDRSKSHNVVFDTDGRP